jgi:crotonobetainyl-CoA:carnitine CoA-transferase CaiB-like acyl-CoA transferase
VMELQAIIKPRLSPPMDGDSNAALAVLSAIMVGLTHQRRTGQGQLITTSMLSGNALCYSDDFCSYESKPARRLPDEDSYGLNALYRVYKASDGWVFLAAPTEREWTDLVKTLGVPDLAADERFATEEARAGHDSDLAATLTAVLGTRPAAELEQTLTSAGVGCVVAFEGGHSGFTSTDPVLFETGLTVEVDHPLFGRIRRHSAPVAFSETPSRVAPGCLRGQHNRSILAGAGYTEAEIDALEETGVVFPPDPISRDA